MGESGGTSLLETPPYVIAVVFLFFLVVTLGFEQVRPELQLSRHMTQSLDETCSSSHYECSFMTSSSPQCMCLCLFRCDGVHV